MDLAALMAEHAPAIHPHTLAQVIQAESGRNPFAIGVNGGQLQWQPRSRPEAVATARALRRSGHDFDAGLCQINVRNWRWLGLDEASVFDPARNLAACQRVLLDCWQRAPAREPQAALRQSFSCFNTGNFSAGFKNGYVARVLRAPVAVPSPAAAKEYLP